jgi:hypothetical protein
MDGRVKPGHDGGERKELVPMTEPLLPPEFADLAPFVGAWALETEEKRQKKRATSTLAEARAFYDATFPQMPAIIAWLDRYTLADLDAGKLPPEAKRLHLLALACMEASHPVEMGWSATDIDDAFPIERLVYLAPSNQR